MTDTVTSPCVGISNEIDSLESERNDLQAELKDASPSMKPFLIREIRQINLELNQLRQQLRLCQEQNPPPPRPDLLAQTVILHVNHAARQLGVAALIRNIGLGNAYGPFRIDLAATIYRGGTTTSLVQTYEVPANVVIYGQPVATQGSALQAASFAPFPGGVIPPFLNHDYVTEDMLIPLYYRDENPSAVYEFEFIADSEQQVAETNEGNNHFFARWWTTTPEAIQRQTPFIIEAKAELSNEPMGRRK